MIKQKVLTLLVLLMTAVSGAWAGAEPPLITIESTGDNASFKSGSKTFDNKVTVTFSGEVYNRNDYFGWYSDLERTLTVTAAAGYTITGVRFTNNSGFRFVSEAPFEAILVFEDGDPYTIVNGTSLGTGGVTKIEVYGTAPATVAVTGVTLLPTTATLTVGETETLTATVLPGDATDKSVTWSSSNEAVATVSNEGVVTAVAAGEATITVTATNGTDVTTDDQTATCTVTVTAPEPENSCGDGLTWEYNSTTNALTISYDGSGTGAMYDYDDENNYAPWLSYNESITSVIISNGVTSIGKTAFYYCTGLTSVTIPNSVTSIGVGAFAMCSSLASIEIPNSVKSIGQAAFVMCSSLESVTINAESLESYGTNAFQGTAEGLKIYVPAGSVATYKAGWAAYEDKIVAIPGGEPQEPEIVNPVLIDGLYYNLDADNMTAEVTYKSYANYEYNEGWGITTANIPASVEYNSVTYSVTSIGYCAFQNCSGLTSVTIPNSVTSIDLRAFMNCSNLESVTIPSSVTSIGAATFGACTALTSIEIPNSVTSIDDQAFAASGLTSITIPNSVTSIGGAAFWYCTGLTSVTIGNSVTSIGEGAFAECSGLETVTINATTPPTLGDVAFESTAEGLKIYVPAGSVDTYKAAENWSAYADQIEAIAGAVTSYDLTVGESLHGTVAFSVDGTAATQAKKDDVVTVTVTPDEGYSTKDVTVRAYTSWEAAARAFRAPSLVDDITVTKQQDGTWTFTMPEANVWVVVSYTKNLQDAWIEAIANQTYTGQALTPAITVKDGETTLTLNTDYTVAYADNTNVGTATVTVTGTGNYSGEASATFTIAKADITMTTAPAAVADLVYSGNPQTLITAGVASFGTVLYSLDGETYAEALPQGTAAGAYTVYYKVEGDDNHNAYAAQTVNVTIATNKTELNTAITDAEAYYNSISETNPDAAATLLEAINTANGVQGNADATQTEIETATTTLNEAVDAAKADVALKRVTIVIPAKSYVARVDADKRQIETAVDGVNLYTVQNVTNSEVVLTSALSVVAAEMPYLIYNDNDEEKTISIVVSAGNADAVEYDSEHFKGTLEAKTFTDADMAAADHYVLSNGHDFVWVKDAGTLAAGKCWIELTQSPNNARTLVIVNEDGTTTGISTVKTAVDTKDAVIYDLQGRRVMQPTKGLFIVNGRKVVIK